MSQGRFIVFEGGEGAGTSTQARLLTDELQRRGIFRRDYEGCTLREHMGLPRPENQFFAKGKERAM